MQSGPVRSFERLTYFRCARISSGSDAISAQIVKPAAVAAALLFGLVASASSQSLNCNGMLAGSGDSATSLVQKCGQPLSIQQVCINVPDSGWVYQPYWTNGSPQFMPTQQCIPMEDWTYDRGQGRYLGIVRLRNGVVESIRDGDRNR